MKQTSRAYIYYMLSSSIQKFIANEYITPLAIKRVPGERCETVPCDTYSQALSRSDSVHLPQSSLCADIRFTCKDIIFFYFYINGRKICITLHAILTTRKDEPNRKRIDDLMNVVSDDEPIDDVCVGQDVGTYYRC